MAKVKISLEQYDELNKCFTLDKYLNGIYVNLVHASGYFPKTEKVNIAKITDYIDRLYRDNLLRLEGMIEEGELE